MIVVRVELHSARTGQVTELARMHVCNEGGTRDLGDYGVYVLRGRSKGALDRGTIQRRGKFGQFPRLRVHVWNLILYAIVAAGYGAVGSPKPAGLDAGNHNERRRSEHGESHEPNERRGTEPAPFDPAP